MTRHPTPDTRHPWLCLLCCVALLHATSLLAHAQVLKLGTIAPEGSPWHDSLKELAQEWKEISNGRLKLRIYPGGIAGDEPDMVRKMRIGQLHGAALTTLGLLSIDEDIEAISFPTMVHNDEELDHVLDTVGPEFEKRLESRGYKVLMWTSTGWVRLFTKDPVVTLEQMQKHKLFFWGNDTVYIEFLKQAGLHPVPLTVTDMLPSLQTGLVNAFAAPPVAALAFQWFGLAKNMTDLRWQPIPGTVVISMKKWRTIPKPMQEELLASARAIGDRLLERSRQMEEEAIEVMQGHGLAVHTLPPETLADWRKQMREKGEPVFVGERISREMFDRVEGELLKFRASRTEP